MTKKEVHRFAQEHLLAALPGYGVRGNLLYRMPVKDILGAFCFERSGWDKQSCAISVFVQPLYVPHEQIHFGFGMRLGFKTDKWWTLVGTDCPAVASDILLHIKKQGLPFLDLGSTPISFVNHIGRVLSSFNRMDDNQVQRALAYSYLWIGNYGKSLETMDRMLANNRGPKRDDRDWAQELVKEVACMREETAKNPNGASEQLRQWRLQTLRAIGFEDVAEPV